MHHARESLHNFIHHTILHEPTLSPFQEMERAMSKDQVGKIKEEHVTAKVKIYNNKFALVTISYRKC